MSDSTEAKLRAMEARLQALEDQVAIYQLMTSYGPSVDSLNEDLTASLWTEDGVYDPGGTPFKGTAGLVSLVRGKVHNDYVKKGSAHLTSFPHVKIDGDTAVATCYSQLFIHQEGEHWRAERTSSNRWELMRTPQGWKIKLRTNRLLTGSEEAKALLKKGFPPKK